jgi:anti-sigma B factor antagonist
MAVTSPAWREATIDLPVRFSCELDADPPGLRIRPAGEIDLTSARRFEARLRAARAAGAGPLLVDLSDTTYMDSTGLRILLRWHEDCRREGIDARIVAVSQAVGRLFEVTDVTELLGYRAGV